MGVELYALLTVAAMSAAAAARQPPPTVGMVPPPVVGPAHRTPAAGPVGPPPGAGALAVPPPALTGAAGASGRDVPVAPVPPPAPTYRLVTDGFRSWYEAVAPGVATPQPFRGGPVWHEGHSCPACGRTVLRIAGRNPDGSHVHVCPVDGTAWTHR